MRVWSAIFFSIFISCGYPDQYHFSGETSGRERTGIEIVIPSSGIETGDQVQARLLLLFSDGSRLIHDGTGVQWASREESVACISESGVITACSAGDAEITAALDDFAASRSIHVAGAQDYSGLALSEVFYDPSGTESGKEFIEICNTGDTDCDISGFRIVDGAASSTPFTFPGGSILARGSRVVIGQSSDGFFSLFGVYPDYAPFSFSLNNSGETVFLLKPDGSVHDVVYIEGGSAEFPASPAWGSASLPSAPEGNSVYRINGSFAGTWQDWGSAGPTPGN